MKDIFYDPLWNMDFQKTEKEWEETFRSLLLEEAVQIGERWFDANPELVVKLAAVISHVDEYTAAQARYWGIHGFQIPGEIPKAFGWRHKYSLELQVLGKLLERLGSVLVVQTAYEERGLPRIKTLHIRPQPE